MCSHNKQETWIWTELLAFDRDLPDCGVKAYLDRLGFVPTGISALLSAVDFVLFHKGMDEEYELFPDVCSRFGHEKNEERARQKWTNYDLRRLISEFHKYNVKIFVSVFIRIMHDRYHKEFVTDHPAIRMGDKIYGLDNAISFLARLEDGTLFEDIFIPKLVEVMRDYGFDGWHGADGQGPGWNLTHSDSSDSFVFQFAEYLGKDKLPAKYLEKADDSEELMAERLDYIWQNFRTEWAKFTSDCWVRFWKKAAEAAHAINCEVMINSPFAKSIFESIFYFGLDYRDLNGLKIDYLITESVVTSCALNYGNYERVFDFSTMIAEMRAILPEMKVIVMPGVKDVVESYDALRHAPCRLERDIFATVSQSIFANGRANRAADGHLICLGDGITTQEWKYLEDIRKMSFSFDISRAGDMVWMVAPEIFDPLVKEYEQFGTMPPYQFPARLTETQNIDISSVVLPENTDQLDQPLFVPMFNLYSDECKAKILARKGLTVLMGRLEDAGLPANIPAIKCKLAENYTLFCTILNGNPIENKMVADVSGKFAFDWKPTYHKFISTRIPRTEIPDEFFDAAGAAIRSNLAPSPLLNPEDNVTCMQFSDPAGNKLVALLSHRDNYCVARYHLEDNGSPLEKLSPFPYSPLHVANGLLALDEHDSPLHLPPRGIILTKINKGADK